MAYQEIHNEMSVSESVSLLVDSVTLTGNLVVPQDAKGIVLFSNASGSSRFSPKNNSLARMINNHQLGTFLFDLLTEEEDCIYSSRFNTELLSKRLIEVTNQMSEHVLTKDYAFAYFGTSTGVAAALDASVCLPEAVKAIVSRSGRPDLAGALPAVGVPVLLIVGSLDSSAITLNKKAFDVIQSAKKMVVLQGASHLFDEPGKLEEVVNLTAEWLKKFIY